MDYRHEPISVFPDVENYITVYIVRIGKYRANFGKVMPANLLHNFVPSRDFAPSICIFLRCFFQTLKGNDVHQWNNTSRFVKMSTNAFVAVSAHNHQYQPARLHFRNGPIDIKPIQYTVECAYSPTRPMLKFGFTIQLPLEIAYSIAHPDSV
jgi:hypothetical protein